MEEKNIGKTIKKEIVRTVLERTQGAIIEKMAESIPADTEEELKGITQVLNIPYVNRAGNPLAMDMFVPNPKPKKEMPVYILVHGGGLVTGDKFGVRKFARKLCQKGNLVFALEYRLVPRANVCQQLDDVCAGMDLVGKKLVDFDVDYTRIYMCAESAGAYLSIYVSAMKKSQKLQDAIGYKASNVPIKALGLFSGMFYTNRRDPIGNILADQFYGKKGQDDYFMNFTDSEHPEIINNLPPIFFVASKGDVLNKYTLDYNKACKKAGLRTHLLYYGSDKLIHAFPVITPDVPETMEVIDKMMAWFEKVHKEVENNEIVSPHQLKINYDFIKEVIDGKNTDMPIYKFIKEVNKYNEKQPALINETRTYTYAQMYRAWDRYASVFSALGITQKNNSRVCLLYPDSTEMVNAFFGLNMVGASVSMMTILEIFNEELWLKNLEKEEVTDIIMMDYVATPYLLHMLHSKKRELGIKHIIVIKNSLNQDAISPMEKAVFEANYFAIKNIPGILFMDDLMEQYDCTDICYGEYKDDDIAVIVHTSGTTKGIKKPIPFTNKQSNCAVSKYYKVFTEEELNVYCNYSLSLDLSGAYSFFEQLLASLCMGSSIVVNYLGAFDSEYYKVVEKYKIACLETSSFMLESWINSGIKPNFSHVEGIAIGGSYVSKESLKRYYDFLNECGSRAKIHNGYGLSEVAGCVTVTLGDIDDSIGYPFPGFKIKIQDEETKKFYDMSDGERVGGLYVSSDSISTGKIGNEQFFDTVKINGDTYICTYDLVRVNKNGTLSCCGRMNNYFVNNEGVKFDAGLLENKMVRQPGIKECVIAPSYNKVIHDTVPIMFIDTVKKEEQEQTIKTALYNIFVLDDTISETNMPSQVIIVNEMPYGQTGKVDRYKLDVNADNLKRLVIEPIKRGKDLIDLVLSPATKENILAQSVPDELKNANPIGMDFKKIFESKELLKFVSPLIISGVLFGRVIPKGGKFDEKKH